MLDQTTRTQIINESIQIGESLLVLADHDLNGISWKTLAANPTDVKGVAWQKSETIYNGVSGIALYFLELYRQTQNDRYLNAVYNSMKWVEAFCQDNPSGNYGFFTGRMGISYIFSRIFALTGENCFLEKAVAIARPCETFLNKPGVVNDLIGGTAGTLLGLLHMHALTGESWILRSINLFTEYLLQNVYHGPQGLYWDRSPNMISGLCGLAHGAAGIGFVFLELGRYFQDEAFYQIAQQAFIYESGFYNPKIRNWPDMRKVIFDQESYEEYKAAYLSGDVDFFVTTSDTNAWCHGAAGIGLTRLRAYELLRQDFYLQEAQIAIEKTIQTALTAVAPTFSLCHGQGGNAELFLEAYRLFQNPQYLDLALQVAQQALGSKKKSNLYLSGYHFAPQIEDISLFMGAAGVGYFYLRLLDPFGSPSILLPKLLSYPAAQLDHSTEPFASFSGDELGEKLFKRMFPRTFVLLQELLPTAPLSIHRDTFYNKASLREAFVQNTQILIDSLPEIIKGQIQAIFELEAEKIRMDERIKSNAILSIQERVRAEQTIQMFEQTDFLSRKIVLNPDVQIKTVTRSPESEQSNELPPLMIILKPTALGVVEADLTLFAFHLLSAFANEQTVNEVFDTLLQDICLPMTPEEAAQTKEIVIQQTKQALAAGFLIQY